MVSKEERIDECERSLLGGMLLDNSIIPNVVSVVKPGAFQGQVNQQIFNTIYELNARGVTCDTISIINENPAIDPVYVAELTNNGCMPSSWKYYAQEIKDAYLLRGMVAISRETENDVKLLAQKPHKDAGEVQSLIDNYQRKFSGLVSNTNSCNVYSLKDLILKESEIIQGYMQNKNTYLGYPTGFESIDKILNGLQPVYMVIGARPSMGKTAIAQKMALNLSKNHKVLFIELEMSPRQLVERAISNLTSIPFSKIQSGLVTQVQLSKILMQMENLANNTNFIPAECPTRQLSDIMNLCRAKVRNEKCKVIFIDHLGLIKTTDTGIPGYERSRIISNELQLLQRELNVPIIALSQLGRGAEESKSVSLSEFRGSGAIEEDADVCAMIQRDRAKDMSDFEIPTDFVIKKNRNGPVGTAKLTFYPNTVNFTDEKKIVENPVEKPTDALSQSKKDFFAKNNNSGNKLRNDSEMQGDWIPMQSDLDYDDEVPF